MSQNALQREVENLNIRSPFPDAEEIREALQRAEQRYGELSLLMSGEKIARRILAANEREKEKDKEKIRQKSGATSKEARTNNKSLANNEKRNPGKTASSSSSSSSSSSKSSKKKK